MSAPIYDKAYFIAKFEAIPEEKWITGAYSIGGCCCAAGHCGARSTDMLDDQHTDESNALFTLLRRQPQRFRLYDVNDGNEPLYQQPTPKARILAALRDLP